MADSEGGGGDGGIVAPKFELSRLMMVGIGEKGELVSLAQTAPNGPWAADWQTVESGGGHVFQTAGLTGDGRVAIALVGKHKDTVSYIDEKPDQPGGKTVWNSAISLGAPFASAKGAVTLAMANCADGRIELFAADGGKSIAWTYQNPWTTETKQEEVTPPGSTTPITVDVSVRVPPSSPWASGWIELAGPGPAIESVTAQSGGNGRITLLVIDRNGELWAKSQTVTPALSASDWSDWVDLTEQSVSGAQAVTASLDRTGAINVFIIGPADYVFTRRQLLDAPGGWGPWALMSDFGQQKVKHIAAGLQADGDITLAAITDDRVLRMTQQLSAPEQRWQAWWTVQIPNEPADLALDYNADGRLELALRGTKTGTVLTLSQIAENSTLWSFNFKVHGSVKQLSLVRDMTPPDA